MSLQNYMKLYQNPTTGLGVPAVEGVIGLYDDGKQSHLYVKLTGPHNQWRYVKSWASAGEDEDITKIAEEMISSDQASYQNNTSAELSSNAYTVKIAEAKIRAVTTIFNAGNTADLQNAINALLDNQVLEIQTNDTYGSILIPVKENIVIRAGAGFAPVFTDANAIRIQNASKDIFLIGLSFLNCTTANSNTKGSAICFEAHATIIDGLFISDCNFELCAGSGILLTYHHTSYTANFTLEQLSKNVAIVDCDFLRASSDATEGGACMARGMNGIFICRCSIDAGDGSVVWAGENKTRGIHLQASINIEIDNCLVKNGNDPTANGEGFKFDMLSAATATFKSQGTVKNCVSYKTKQGFDADDQSIMNVINCKAFNCVNEGFIANKATSEGSFESCIAVACDLGFRLCGPVPASAFNLSNNLCVDCVTDDYCLDNGDILSDSNKKGVRSFIFEQTVNLTEFVSIEQTGNAGAQSIAHGLGRIPSKVLIVVTDSATGVYTITEGAHDITNVIVTVTNNVKYKVFAK